MSAHLLLTLLAFLHFVPVLTPPLFLIDLPNLLDLYPHDTLHQLPLPLKDQIRLHSYLLLKLCLVRFKLRLSKELIPQVFENLCLWIFLFINENLMNCKRDFVNHPLFCQAQVLIELFLCLVLIYRTPERLFLYHFTNFWSIWLPRSNRYAKLNDLFLLLWVDSKLFYSQKLFSMFRLRKLPTLLGFLFGSSPQSSFLTIFLTLSVPRLGKIVG